MIPRMLSTLDFAPAIFIAHNFTSDGRKEFISRNVCRARARNQSTADPNKIHRAAIQPSIRKKRALTLCPPTRKSRRIHNDGPPRCICRWIFDPLENIRLDLISAIFPRKTASRRPVELEIASTTSKGMSANVHIRHRICPTRHRRYRKGTRETKEIEHMLASSKFADALPVIPLIEKEPRFLSTEDIRFKEQAIFFKNDRPIGSLTKKHLTRLSIHTTRIARATKHNPLNPRQLFDSWKHSIQPRQPSRRINFDNGRFRIAVQNETWPTIIFAIDQAKPISLLRLHHSIPPLHRLAETRFPPSIIERSRLPRMKHTKANRRIGIIETHREKLLFTIVDDSHLTRLPLTIRLTHTISEDPRVPATDFCFRLRGELQLKAGK